MDVFGKEDAVTARARFDEALVLHLLVEDQVAVVEALIDLIATRVRREAEALPARGEELDVRVLLMGFGALLLGRLRLCIKDLRKDIIALNLIAPRLHLREVMRLQEIQRLLDGRRQRDALLLCMDGRKKHTMPSCVVTIAVNCIMPSRLL